MCPDNRKKKVGLALSGGAARGLAHVGVIRVLQEEGVPIDIVAGTSAGAVVGAIYAASRDAAVVMRHTLDVSWKRLAPLIDPSFPWTGLIRGKKITNVLSGFLGGDIEFSDLKLPFACVATDIDTGEEIVMDRGLVLDALRASISIPGIFTVVRREGRFLVDGGLTTPVPVNVIRRMGADLVIAVNVNPSLSAHMAKSGRKRAGARKNPNIFQVMMQSFYITTGSLAQSSLANSDVVIEPDLTNIGAGDFHKASELIALGEKAARKAIPEIKRKLKE